MKKRILSLVGLSAMALLLSVSSCKKSDVSSDALVLDQTKTCTLKGKVYAQLDLVNDANSTTGSIWETPTSGTMMYFKVDNSDYLTGAAGSKIYSASITNGAYEVVIPASPKGAVSVTIMFNDFEALQTQEKLGTGTPVVHIADGTKKAVYTHSDVTVSVTHEGSEIYTDFTYNDNLSIQ